MNELDQFHQPTAEKAMTNENPNISTSLGDNMSDQNSIAETAKVLQFPSKGKAQGQTKGKNKKPLIPAQSAEVSSGLSEPELTPSDATELTLVTGISELFPSDGPKLLKSNTTLTSDDPSNHLPQVEKEEGVSPVVTSLGVSPDPYNYEERKAQCSALLAEYYAGGCKVEKLKKVFKKEHSSWDNRKTDAKKSGIGFADDFKSFADFLRIMGPMPFPSATLDRIDVAKGYYPDNVRWSNKETQAQNQGHSIELTFNGSTKYLSEWATLYKQLPNTVRKRYYKLKDGLPDTAYEIITGKKPVGAPKAPPCPAPLPSVQPDQPVTTLPAPVPSSLETSQGQANQQATPPVASVPLFGGLVTAWLRKDGVLHVNPVPHPLYLDDGPLFLTTPDYWEGRCAQESPEWESKEEFYTRCLAEFCDIERQYQAQFRQEDGSELPIPDRDTSIGRLTFHGYAHLMRFFYDRAWNRAKLIEERNQQLSQQRHNPQAQDIIRQMYALRPNCFAFRKPPSPRDYLTAHSVAVHGGSVLLVKNHIPKQYQQDMDEIKDLFGW